MITKQNKGFTLLELLLVIVVIGILAAIVLVAINPNRQIEAARQAKRRADINSITKAIQQYSIDNNGQYPVGIETGAKPICQTGNTPTGCINLSTTLVPTYIASIPVSDSNNYYVRRSVAGTSIEVTHPRDNIWNIGGTPSLDLNFAKNKSLIDGVSGNNLVTFTRNSIGTYIGEDGTIKTAVANEPRFDHNPTTGESLGLLIEDQRTNLVSNSSSNSAGFETSNTTQMYGIAPNGTKSSVRWNAPNTFTYIRAFFSVTQGVKYTLSIYVKGQSNVQIIPDGSFGGGVGYGSINLSTGVTTGYSEGVQVVQYQNGWRRISFQRTASSTGTGQLGLTTNNNMAADIEFWGPQVEVGSFSTSYIPTSGSALTRVADVASITGANFSSWYNPSEFTLLFQGGAQRWVCCSGLYQFFNQNIGGLRYWSNGGSFGFNPPQMNLPVLNVADFKIAHGFKNGYFVGSVSNQPSIVSTTNSSYPTIDNDRVNFWYDFRGITSNSNGTVKRFIYWPTLLADTTVKNLTQ